MHYVDEGAGAPVVMLHGNPTWSFLYRALIRQLAPACRCVAPDYIGFGRSDKPADAAYGPAAQAARVEALITRLGLRELTLVAHDWGGPIALAYALRHPGTVRHLVLTNTWGWPLHRDLRVALFSRLAGSPLGRWAITRGNAFARVVMPLALAPQTRLPAAVWRHYRAPLATPSDRIGSWAFPRALLGATPWLTALWADRHRLADLPMTLVWGLRDPAFRARHLRRWITAFPHARVRRLPTVGHYVPEEAPAAVARAVLAPFTH